MSRGHLSKRQLSVKSWWKKLYGTNARMVFTHGHVPDLMDPHVYNLLEPVDCEDLYLDKTPMDQLTRLALARALERQGNGNTKDT